MKRALVAVVVLVAALAGAASSSPSSATVHAIVWQKNTVSLATLDATTLAPRGRLLALGRASGVTADRLGDRLAVASATVGVVVVDTRRMRVVWRLPGGPHVRAISWLSPRRLLVVQHGAVLLIDPATRRTLARTRYEGNVISSERWSGGLVLLAERGTGKLEPARLLVVDGRARMRAVELGRIQSGADGGENNQGPHRIARPGLAVDPSAGVAFVAGGLVVARVDLASLVTTYSGTERTEQKLAAGPSRSVAWLGGGTLAVSGADDSESGDPRSLTRTPFGLRYIKGERVSIVDERPTHVVAGAGLALAYVDRHGAMRGIGLTAYDRAGAVRWHLFGDEALSGVQVARGRAYLWVSPDWQVVDLATGAIVGRAAIPRDLLGRLRWDHFQILG